MIKQFLLLLVVCALAYFFYVRDRYVDYPIAVTLTDQQKRSVDAQILWRDASRIQFEKPQDSRLYFYEIDQLSWWSRAKIVFLPISQAKAVGYMKNNNIQRIHIDALKKEHSTKSAELAQLNLLAGTSLSTIETNTLERQIEALERKLAELEARIQRSFAQPQ